MTTANFQNTVFLSYFGETDVSTANYTPGRFLITSKAPPRKKPKLPKSNTEKKTLPRIESKAKTHFDGFKEFPPEKIDRDNAEAVVHSHPGVHQTDNHTESSEPEGIGNVASACIAERRGEPKAAAATVP